MKKIIEYIFTSWNDIFALEFTSRGIKDGVVERKYGTDGKNQYQRIAKLKKLSSMNSAYIFICLIMA